MTGRFTVKLGGLEYRTSYCLIPDVPWASVLEMVSNTKLTSCVTTGPWAIRVGCENEDVLSSAKGKGREEYDEDIRCVTSAWV